VSFSGDAYFNEMRARSERRLAGMAAGQGPVGAEVVKTQNLKNLEQHTRNQ
jgi:hypothetical protein